MKRVTDTESFIAKAISVHGSKYDYSNTVYTKNKDKLEITCKVHGSYFQIANDHITGKGKGCTPCGYEANAVKSRADQIGVIRSFNKVHTGYDYTQFTYKGKHSKAKVICPAHSMFLVTPSNHLKGSGCPHCAVDRHPYSTILTPTIAESNKHTLELIPCYVYVMRSNCGVHKVGISVKPQNRLNELNRDSGMTFSILTKSLTSRHKAYLIEQHLHELFDKYRFTTVTKFAGCTEVFSLQGKHVTFLNSYIQDLIGAT